MLFSSLINKSSSCLFKIHELKSGEDQQRRLIIILFSLSTTGRFQQGLSSRTPLLVLPVLEQLA